MSAEQLLDIFQRARAKVVAAPAITPKPDYSKGELTLANAVGQATDEMVLGWRPARAEWGRKHLLLQKWPYHEFWSHPINGAINGARLSFLQCAIGALDTVARGAVRRRPSGREMLTFGGIRQYDFVKPLWSDGAVREVPDKAAALALLDRAIGILQQQETPPAPQPQPQPDPTPSPTPDPSPTPTPSPQPGLKWRVIDANGGIADLRDWAGAVGADDVIAYVVNATVILFWQWPDRVDLWRRADGRYQLVERHASGQTFVAEPKVTSIAWGRRDISGSEPIDKFLLPSSGGRAEPQPPSTGPSIPATFPPNPFGFVSTEGLTMAEFDRVKAFIAAADAVKMDPAAVTTALDSMASVDALSKVVEPANAAAIAAKNAKVATFLKTLIPPAA